MHDHAEPAHPEAAPVAQAPESAASREESVLALSEAVAEAPEGDPPEPGLAEQAPAAEPHLPGLPAAASTGHGGTGEAMSHDALDEPTTIVLAEASSEADEVTTLVPALLEQEDEPTTIVQAPPSEVDEVTVFLPAEAPHEQAEEDEATMLVASSGYDSDESTTLVHAGPVEAGDEPSPIRSAPGSLHAPESAPLPPATGGQAHDESVTEIRHAVLPGGAGQGPPDWFTDNLQHFTQALRQDETGAARAPQEMQQLALVARDMIARIAMQGGARTAAEGWTGDTVLQPDQLLANTYIVRSLIARGGVGEIYRTRHRDLKTEHAVKVLLPRYALDPTVLTLMQDEARLLACVRHEAVVRCQDLLRDADGRPMLVMDFLRGRTLSARLREGRLATPDLIVLARRLAEGLTAIHAAGIIHQDISPDNVILADDSCGAATIIDFGLARRVGTGRDMHRNLDFAGKYSWSSPEQLSGRPAAVDARSDLYSLGLMLAAAARGYRLDMGQDLESARAARTTVPSLAGIEQPLAGLIEALLAPAPDARLGSATDIEPMLEPRPRSLWSRVAPYFGLRASA